MPYVLMYKHQGILEQCKYMRTREYMQVQLSTLSTHQSLQT